MTTLKVKKRLMYSVFAFIFICGGVEYAVILPTLWLYLHNEYAAPEYMLGLVLAAYSLAALFSAPIIGRISDRFACSKKIFIICAIFELVGSFLYFIEISKWLCLGSRFVSGLGAASEAVAIAEISKYTAEKERTSIISYLVAMRQIALLIGPGLNAFLRLANFKIGPFEVNKYTAPGAFMVISWSMLILAVLTLYTEPKLIYAQSIEQTITTGSEDEHNVVSGGTVADDRKDDEHFQVDTGSDTHRTVKEDIERDTEQLEQSDNSDYETESNNLLYPTNFYNIQEKIPANDGLDDHDFLQSTDNTPFEFPPLSFHSRRKSEDIDSDTFKSVDISRDSHYDSYSSSISAEFHDVQESPQKEDCSEVSKTGSLEDNNHLYNSCNLSSSLDLLISAERIINNSQYVKTLKDNGGNVDTSLVFNENHFGVRADDFCNNTQGSSYNERSALLQRNQRTDLSGSQISLLRSYGANSPYIERSTSCLYDPIAIEGKLGFFCNEYIRDEIVAIIYLLFCAMFSQMCVETMVLPLSLTYLDFNELDNSLLYCACGVEIIIVFVIVSKLSKWLSDRSMMMFGAVVLIASNIWLICFLPNAPPHNRMHNIPMFAVAVFLDVLSLPFLTVCATSLYSKLTRKQTQGLSQGLRRGVVGLGLVIAPLWGSSAVNRPYLLLGVLLALQGLSLILCTLSYKHFKVVQAPSALSSTSISQSNDAVIRPVNHTSPNMPSGNNIHKRNKRRAKKFNPVYSASYGSIQISIAGSSYRSLDIPTEHQHVQSHHPVV